jgi:hypothetical protein
MRKAMMAHRCHLGREPAAQTKPNYDYRLNLQFPQHPFINDRHVAYGAHPLGTFRPAETGMRRYVNRETFGEHIVKPQPSRIADIVMEHNKGSASSCLQHLDFAASNLNEAFSRRHKDSFPNDQLLAPAWLLNIIAKSGELPSAANYS